jgi:hypothetical protein
MDRRTFDEAQQRNLLALIAAGFTRKTAARSVGCSMKTIARTAARDAAFAERLRHASHHSELKFLDRIAHAAESDQHWRAAAWALERLFPDRYARRKPAEVTREHMESIITLLCDAVADELPVEARRRVHRRLRVAMRKKSD